MRMVETFLMVSKLYSFDHADPIVSIEVSDSKDTEFGQIAEVIALKSLYS